MFNNTNTKAIRSEAALELARYKMRKEISGGHKYPSLDEDDVNEIMLVAGLPFISANEMDVLEFTHDEDEEDNENE